MYWIARPVMMDLTFNTFILPFATLMCVCGSRREPVGFKDSIGWGWVRTVLNLLQ